MKLRVIPSRAATLLAASATTAFMVAAAILLGADGNRGVAHAATMGTTAGIGAERLGTPAPINSTLPAIRGSGTVGAALSSSAGTWSGSPISYAYQWQRCNATGGACSPISGATGTQYTATTGDIGSRMRSTVVASNEGGTGSATSVPSAVVAATSPPPPPPPTTDPVNLTLPVITGTPQASQVLTVTNGTWSPNPTSYLYAWQRCDSSGANCALSPTSSSVPTYALTSGDVGFRITVQIAPNKQWAASVRATPTAAISGTSSPPPPPPTATLNTVATVLYGMQPANEGQPTGFGIPTPALSYNSPPSTVGTVEAWGQIFTDTTNVIPANVRVEVKNMETYVWSNSGKKWVRVQGLKRFGGAWYAYGFKTHTPADTRVEPDGGQSVTMKPGYLYHFFPTVHAPIVPSDVGAVFTTYQARLILDNPAGPDNLAQTRFVADSGADWYPTPGQTINGHPNVAVGFGKFMYLTSAWRPINFYTGGPGSAIASGKTPSAAWTESQLLASAPPLDGMGAP